MRDLTQRNLSRFPNPRPDAITLLQIIAKQMSMPSLPESRDCIFDAIDAGPNLQNAIRAKSTVLVEVNIASMRARKKR